MRRLDWRWCLAALGGQSRHVHRQQRALIPPTSLPVSSYCRCCLGRALRPACRSGPWGLRSFGVSSDEVEGLPHPLFGVSAWYSFSSTFKGPCCFTLRPGAVGEGTCGGLRLHRSCLLSARCRRPVSRM